jgi:hypothetical protein
MYKILFIAFVLCAYQSNATLDAQMRESVKCTKFFALNERKYNLPKNTLHSIALQESGRIHPVYKRPIPWPWAVNSQGKSFYFNNKAAAVNFIQKQFDQNNTNIDVGCMQINLKHHARYFKSIQDAIEPKTNIEYGAKFLQQKFQQHRNWPAAIAHYHCAKPEIGLLYSKKVFNIARNIERNNDDIAKFYRKKREFRNNRPKYYTSQNQVSKVKYQH